MNRFLDAESNGGIFIDIACSEPSILTCKVIGRKRNITRSYYRKESAAVAHKLDANSQPNKSTLLKLLIK